MSVLSVHWCPTPTVVGRVLLVTKGGTVEGDRLPQGAALPAPRKIFNPGGQPYLPLARPPSSARDWCRSGATLAALTLTGNP
jgi:hypothetical protein